MTDEEFLNELSLVEMAEGSRADAIALIARFRQEAVAEVAPRDRWKTIPPADQVLHCPECGQQHLDLGEFATRPHRRHLCEQTPSGRTGCGHLWRASDYPTRGVLRPPMTLVLYHHPPDEHGDHEVYYFTHGRPMTVPTTSEKNLAVALDRMRLLQLREFAETATEAPGALRFVDALTAPLPPPETPR